MTKLLTPRLGFFTAEEVVRHVCARFLSADFADEKQLGDLREFMRLGLRVADSLGSTRSRRSSVEKQSSVISNA